MKVCENCGKEHDGTYGSGRFCNCKCSRGFATKNKRAEINAKVSKSLLGRKLSEEHKIHLSESLKGNKNLSQKLKGRHLTNEHKKNIGLASKGRKHSDEYKTNMSNMMKIKVQNGTHKGWQSRNIKSYPEIFFESVLENNNISNKCIREFKISKKDLGLDDYANYFLDFFFPEKMIDLEIDGKQHWEDTNRIESDKIRDFVLSENNYKVYRIKWQSINTIEGKEYMQNEINKFLDFYQNN